MAGIAPVFVLLAVFIWLGVSPRPADRWTWVWLLVSIVAVIILDFYGIFPGYRSS